MRPAVLAAIAILVALAGCLHLVLAVLLTRLPHHPAVLAAAGILSLLGALHLAAAGGVWRFARWGRALLQALAVLSFLVVPWGPFVGLVVLRYLRRPEVVGLFPAAPRPGTLPGLLAEPVPYMQPTPSRSQPLVTRRLVTVGVLTTVAFAVLLSVVVQRARRLGLEVVSVRRVYALGQALARSFASAEQERRYYQRLPNGDFARTRFAAPLPLDLHSASDLGRLEGRYHWPSSPLAVVDGWGNPILVRSHNGGGAFLVVSLGADGRPGPVYGGSVADPDADIMFASDNWYPGLGFLQWPARAEPTATLLTPPRTEGEPTLNSVLDAVLPEWLLAGLEAMTRN